MAAEFLSPEHMTRITAVLIVSTLLWMGKPSVASAQASTSPAQVEQQEMTPAELKAMEQISIEMSTAATKGRLAFYASPDGVRQLADFTKHMVDALTARGFTRGEALGIVATIVARIGPTGDGERASLLGRPMVPIAP